MSAKGGSTQENPIDARAEEILKRVIVNYILTGEPVGSRTIAKLSREGLSPASVRNVMADLEETGFLAQPHTSAGRIPTDKGYRYYVDGLLDPVRLSQRDKTLIDESLSRVASEFGEAMEIIPKILSRLSRHVGYVITPPIREAVLKHIEFVSLQEKRVLCVFVDRSGVVSHRMIEVEEEYAQADLDRAGRYLVEEFTGLTLGDIRARLVGLMVQEKAAFDVLLKSVVNLGTRYLNAEQDERRLVLEGTTNIMKHPEFADMDTMRRLFETFEEKQHLVNLLDRCLDAPGVRIVIGSETDDPALKNLALVASPYQVDERSSGIVGLLGPTRMEYERAVALVDYISRLLSSLLTSPPH